MRRGRFSAVRPIGGGGCRTESSQRETEIVGSSSRFVAAARATRGVQWPAAFEPIKWFVAGDVFLQQSSAFADGAHWPLRQHFIASGVRAVAKQSKGRARSTMAIRLTTIRRPRFIYNPTGSAYHTVCAGGFFKRPPAFALSPLSGLSCHLFVGCRPSTIRRCFISQFFRKKLPARRRVRGSEVLYDRTTPKGSCRLLISGGPHFELVRLRAPEASNLQMVGPSLGRLGQPLDVSLRELLLCG